ncbi:hypothetical protein E4U59_006543 [Claviceps monticola]|nr:hypothetical protein E4U59_006543 [Claviceps monticola]
MVDFSPALPEDEVVDLAARAQQKVSCAPFIVVTHEETKWLSRALTDAIGLLLGASSCTLAQKAVMRFFTKSVTTKGLSADTVAVVGFDHGPETNFKQNLYQRCHEMAVNRDSSR